MCITLYRGNVHLCVCLSGRTLKSKQHILSTPKSHGRCLEGNDSEVQKIKGHEVIKTAGVGLQVDITVQCTFF